MDRHRFDLAGAAERQESPPDRVGEVRFRVRLPGAERLLRSLAQLRIGSVAILGSGNALSLCMRCKVGTGSSRSRDRRLTGRREGYSLGPMPRLSVNLNKIALLRNSRRTGVPDVRHFGQLAHDAGADGLTLHPRPDERHIRKSDVFAVAELMQPWRPVFELNLEGYPDRRFLDIVGAVKPEQCTLVPDSPEAFTSEEGWKLDAAQRRLIGAAMTELKTLGCRVILFIDPDPAAVAPARDVGADGIEIYTGGYAAGFRAGDPDPLR
ncbi:MAG: pyridoxine 5'-phosphate synthase, partial [Stellaceae bacterium]